MVCHREEAAADTAAASYTFCTEKYKKNIFGVRHGRIKI